MASNAKRLEDSRAALLDCMREAKVDLDEVFARAGSEPCDNFPDADPAAFSVWLKAEVGQLVPLLDNVFYFGAYGATLAVARSFQATGCDHLKRLGRVNNNFPSVDDVRGAAENRACKNVCARFLKKFWMEGGGWALAFGEATSGAQEVRGMVLRRYFCCQLIWL